MIFLFFQVFWLCVQLSVVSSFGVILWQFRERQEPFAGLCLHKQFDLNHIPASQIIIDEIDKVILANVKGGMPFNAPKCECPPGYGELTNQCCSMNPKDRPAFEGDFESVVFSIIEWWLT